jgi:hypothetical protein
MNPADMPVAAVSDPVKVRSRDTLFAGFIGGMVVCVVDALLH